MDRVEAEGIRLIWHHVCHSQTDSLRIWIEDNRLQKLEQEQKRRTVEEYYMWSNICRGKKLQVDTEEESRLLHWNNNATCSIFTVQNNKCAILVSETCITLTAVIYSTAVLTFYYEANRHTHAGELWWFRHSASNFHHQTTGHEISAAVIHNQSL